MVFFNYYSTIVSLTKSCTAPILINIDPIVPGGNKFQQIIELINDGTN